MEGSNQRRVVTRRKPLSDCTNTSSSSSVPPKPHKTNPSSSSSSSAPAKCSTAATTTNLDNTPNPTSPSPPIPSTPSLKTPSLQEIVDVEAYEPISVVYSRRSSNKRKREKGKAVAVPVSSTPNLKISDSREKNDEFEGVNLPKAKAMTVPRTKKQRCIYKWLHFQSTSVDNEEQQEPQCPVCKSEVSQSSLVPLYGRGQTTIPSKGKPHQVGTTVIPQRPHGPRTLNTRSVSQPVSQSYHPYSNPYHPPQFNSIPSGYTSPMIRTSGSLDNTFGIFGEMIYARVFGNQVSNIHTYANSYNLSGTSNPRMRRHLMQVDKSLSRISCFLLCCLVLCLLLF